MKEKQIVKIGNIYYEIPYFREILRIKNLCRLVGFSDGQTATFVKGKPLEYAGELYSEEHKRKFKTEKVRASAESPDGRD